MTSLESEELDRTETMQKRCIEDDEYLREKRQRKARKVRKQKRKKVSPREF